MFNKGIAKWPNKGKIHLYKKKKKQLKTFQLTRHIFNHNKEVVHSGANTCIVENNFFFFWQIQYDSLEGLYLLQEIEPKRKGQTKYLNNISVWSHLAAEKKEN